MTNKEAAIWLLNLSDDIGKAEHQSLWHYEQALQEMREMLECEPERKKGKWIYNSPVTMKCDQCGFVIKDWDWHRFKFCPNCDCDMRGEQE